MKIVYRLVTACLLVCLLAPQLARAGGDMGEVAYDIGEKLFARKEYKTALKYYRRALQRNDVRALYRMGLIYENGGRDKDALEQYRRYIELGQPDAQRSDAVQRVAAIEERQKKQAARSADLLERGKDLFAKGKYREAEKALLQAAAKNPSRAQIHFYLGEVYMQREAYAKAKAEYKKAEKLSLK
jgi:tetratricopeptide (TPR) repeat protein